VAEKRPLPTSLQNLSKRQFPPDSSRRRSGSDASHLSATIPHAHVRLYESRYSTFLSTPAHPVNLDAGFSINGWLAVLLTFVLARVFAEGALMREDLEGTV
jgi:hypothetical protein